MKFPWYQKSKMETTENTETRDSFLGWYIGDWDFPTKVPDWDDVKSTVVQFHVNRLVDILSLTTKTLEEKEEFRGNNVTISSAVTFGPVRLSVSINKTVGITNNPIEPLPTVTTVEHLQ